MGHHPVRYRALLLVPFFLTDPRLFAAFPTENAPPPAICFSDQALAARATQWWRRWDIKDRLAGGRAAHIVRDLLELKKKNPDLISSVIYWFWSRRQAYFAEVGRGRLSLARARAATLENLFLPLGESPSNRPEASAVAETLSAELDDDAGSASSNRLIFNTIVRIAEFYNWHPDLILLNEKIFAKTGPLYYQGIWKLLYTLRLNEQVPREFLRAQVLSIWERIHSNKWRVPAELIKICLMVIEYHFPKDLASWEALSQPDLSDEAFRLTLEALARTSPSSTLIGTIVRRVLKKAGDDVDRRAHAEAAFRKMWPAEYFVFDMYHKSFEMKFARYLHRRVSATGKERTYAIHRSAQSTIAIIAKLPEEFLQFQDADDFGLMRELPEDLRPLLGEPLPWDRRHIMLALNGMDEEQIARELPGIARKLDGFTGSPYSRGWEAKLGPLGIFQKRDGVYLLASQIHFESPSDLMRLDREEDLSRRILSAELTEIQKQEGVLFHVTLRELKMTADQFERFVKILNVHRNTSQKILDTIEPFSFNALYIKTLKNMLGGIEIEFPFGRPSPGARRLMLAA